MKIGTLILSIILCLILSGCTIDREIIDDISLVTIIGLDLIDDNKIEGTVSIPNFKPDKSVTSEVFHDVSTLIFENRTKLNTKSNRPLIVGKLEMVLFNNELAKNGLEQYIDFFLRESSISTRLKLGIVEGKAKDILTNIYESHDTGMFLSELFTQNEDNGTIPRMNLHLYDYKFHSEYYDPFMPMIRLNEEKKVEFIGVALFRDDKYVGKIPFEQMFTFNVMVGKLGNATFTLHKEEESAVVKSIMSKSDILIDQSEAKPKITMNIKLRGILREYQGEDITKEKVKQIGKDIEKKITKQAEEIIKTLQELKIDPIGFAHKYKTVNRNFDIKKWEEMYPDIEITAKVKVDIMEYGVKK